MARETLLILAVMLVTLVAVEGRYYGRRIRRGFNNGGSGYGFGNKGGYGRNSDENDASVSQENNNSGGCSSGHDKSGSRELAYNRDGRQQSGEHIRGGRSFTRSSASATASAASFGVTKHHKNNAIPS